MSYLLRLFVVLATILMILVGYYYGDVIASRFAGFLTWGYALVMLVGYALDMDTHPHAKAPSFGKEIRAAGFITPALYAVIGMLLVGSGHWFVAVLWTILAYEAYCYHQK